MYCMLGNSLQLFDVTETEAMQDRSRGLFLLYFKLICLLIYQNRFLGRLSLNQMCVLLSEKKESCIQLTTEEEMKQEGWGLEVLPVKNKLYPDRFCIIITREQEMEMKVHMTLLHLLTSFITFR